MFGQEPAAPEPEVSLPILASGLERASFGTSVAAAVSVQENAAAQRAKVKACLRAAERHGRTDHEMQMNLHMKGDSQRPRRWELYKLGEIEILRDADGNDVRRATSGNHKAVVWVLTEKGRLTP